MTRFPQPKAAEARPSADPADPARSLAPVRPGAVLIPFPPGTHMRHRAPLPGERRGEILFFLGVRYERHAS